MGINKNKPTVPDVIPLIKLFLQHPDNLVGGNLHIYLSDGNCEESNIRFCMNKCIESGDYLGEGICRISLRMSITQRKKLSSYFAYGGSQ